MRVACIGTRELKSAYDKDLCYSMGRYLAQGGFTVVSGNAEGADQTYAKGVNEINPALLELWLPWASYNEEAIRKGNQVNILSNWMEEGAIMSSLHPLWTVINQAVKKLMMRNVRIVRGCVQVIALPSRDKPWGGGTGMGLKIADYFGIPKLNLCHAHDRARAYRKVFSPIPEDLRAKITEPMCSYTGRDHIIDDLDECLMCNKSYKVK